MDSFDIVVIGGGHNMLTAAAYLARAGLHVGVFESREYLGGGAVTREPVLPGFKMETDSVVHGLVRLNPMLAKNELELETKYGLEYLDSDIVYANIFEDGTHFCIYTDVEKTAESIAQVNKHDGETYRKFIDYSLGIMKFLANGLYAPPTRFGQTWNMLDSTPEGQQILRIMMSSPWEIAKQWFEDEHVLVALMKVANEAMAFPWTRDSGIAIYTMCGLTHMVNPDGRHPYGTPKGGGGELSQALKRAIEDMGGTVMVNSRVDEVIIENGKAVGVRLHDGTRVKATRAVLCGANPMRAFKKDGLVRNTPDDLAKLISQLKPDDHSTLVSNYALNERPKYKVGGEFNNAILVELLPSLDDFMDHYYACMMGRIAKKPVLYVACHDVLDPTKSPDGHASIQVYDPAPYFLKEGPQHWDEIKEEVENKKLEWVRKFTTNMGDDNILGRYVNSPLDLERRSENFVYGNISSLGRGFAQFQSNRPIPELGQYRVPWVEGLYIGGPGSHPGGGVSGGGRAPAMRMLEDFDLDFDDVVAGKYLKKK